MKEDEKRVCIRSCKMVLWPIAYYYYYYGAHVLFELFYKDISSVERKITELVTSTFISHELVTISSLSDVEVNPPVNVLIRRTS